MNPNQKNNILQTIDFVKTTLRNAESGHDWWHVYRVWQLAEQIARTENVDLFIVEIGALLHDIADSKFHYGDETVGPRVAREFLTKMAIEEKNINHIENIIKNISYKLSLGGGQNITKFHSLELDVVQDADRLDAIGAIGIARAFNYGGHVNREIYNPDIKPNSNLTKEQYKNSQAPSLNHFYEKLLLLKDKMNTKTGRRLAEHRHQFMEEYLNEFYQEWGGKK